jgi:hypothetical protein
VSFSIFILFGSKHNSQAANYLNAVKPRNIRKAVNVPHNMFFLNITNIIKPITIAVTRSKRRVVSNDPDGIKIILEIRPASIAYATQLNH